MFIAGGRPLESVRPVRPPVWPGVPTERDPANGPLVVPRRRCHVSVLSGGASSILGSESRGGMLERRAPQRQAIGLARFFTGSRPGTQGHAACDWRGRRLEVSHLMLALGDGSTMSNHYLATGASACRRSGSRCPPTARALRSTAGEAPHPGLGRANCPFGCRLDISQPRRRAGGVCGSIICGGRRRYPARRT